MTGTTDLALDRARRTDENLYILRIVGDPDSGTYDEHETIPFDDLENLKNVLSVLDTRGIRYSTQVPNEVADEIEGCSSE